MASPFLAAAPIAVLPAMGVLWYLLKRYEEYFDDARVFFSLVVGFFVGLFAIAFETLAIPFADPLFVASMGVWTSFVFFTVGYAFFETALKVVVLGTRGYRTRKDTPYYGAALGLGMGAMMALGTLTVAFTRASDFIKAPGLDISALQLVLLLSLLSLVPVAAVFTHGAAGIWVGKNVSEGLLWRGWVVGTAIQIPVLVAFWVLLLFIPLFGASKLASYGVPAVAVAAFAYGLWVLLRAQDRVLDHVVPPEIRDQVRRERRREARRRQRGEEPAEPRSDARGTGAAAAAAGRGGAASASGETSASSVAAEPGGTADRSRPGSRGPGPDDDMVTLDDAGLVDLDAEE